MTLEWDEDGLEGLQRQLEMQFSDGLQVPLDGSEEDAIRSVTDQLRIMGVMSNDEEVVKIVRKPRDSEGGAGYHDQPREV